MSIVNESTNDSGTTTETASSFDGNVHDVDGTGENKPDDVQQVIQSRISRQRLLAEKARQLAERKSILGGLDRLLHLLQKAGQMSTVQSHSTRFRNLAEQRAMERGEEARARRSPKGA